MSKPNSNSQTKTKSSCIMSFEDYQKMIDKTTFVSTNPPIPKPMPQPKKVNYITLTSRFRSFTTSLYNWFLHLIHFTPFRIENAKHNKFKRIE